MKQVHLAPLNVWLTATAYPEPAAGDGSGVRMDEFPPLSRVLCHLMSFFGALGTLFACCQPGWSIACQRLMAQLEMAGV